jgi:hypothetical protein
LNFWQGLVSGFQDGGLPCVTKTAPGFCELLPCSQILL